MNFLNSGLYADLRGVLREYRNLNQIAMKETFEAELSADERQSKLRTLMRESEKAHELLAVFDNGGPLRDFLYRLLDPTDNENRATGRSTDIAKSYVSIASNNKDMWIKPVDHHPGAGQAHIGPMLDLIKQNTMSMEQDFEFKKDQFRRVRFSAQCAAPEQPEPYYG